MEIVRFPSFIRGGWGMNNKGFSMVELIIVITVIVILVGLISPMLIKNVYKARLSSDLDLGREIGIAIMSTVVEDDVYRDAVEHDVPYDLHKMDGTIFRDAVCKHLAVANITDIVGKTEKDVENEVIPNKFFYTLDAEKNKVSVYYGKADEDYQIYPVIGKKFDANK